MAGLIDPTKVATGVATNLVEDAFKSMWKKIKNDFKDASKQEEIKLGDAFKNYLENTKEKYGKIKNLIYKRKSEDLYSMYVNFTLTYGDEMIDSSDINNLINEKNKIIITGTGGIGKSTLMRHLFLNTIDETDYVPVLIELRSLNSRKEISIKDEVYKALSDNGFKLENEYFEFSLETGCYIFLFDGYDEVKKDIIKKVSEEIRSFSDKYHENSFIVSSRPSSEFIGWNDFDEMSPMPFSEDQSVELIKKLKFDEAIKNKFLDELKNGLYDRYQSFAEIPLLLTIMLLTYERNAKIPENKNDFYERVFLVLFSEHNATKEGYERDICLSYDKFKRIFSYFCFISYFKDVYEFTNDSLIIYLEMAQNKYLNIKFNTEDFKEDLIKHVCMLIEDGGSYRFAHRSFQEYFAALYTCQLTDEQQKNFFEKVLSNPCIQIEYCVMIFDMQENRFMQNILLPYLNQLQYMVGSKKSYSKVIDILVENIGIEVENGIVKVSYSVYSNSACYHNILDLISIFLNDEPLCSINEMNNAQHYEKELFENIAKRKKIEINRDNINWFETKLEELTDEEKNLLTSSWLGILIKNKYLFAMDILDRYSTTSSEREKTLSDLLAEL